MSSNTPTPHSPDSDNSIEFEVAGISAADLRRAVARAEQRIGQGCQFVFNEGSNITIVVSNEMGDNTDVSGRVQGSVIGSGSVNVGGDQVFGDLWKTANDDIKDLAKLRKELSELYRELAAASDSRAERESVAAIGEAIEAAEAGNGPQVLKHLQAAGKWAFDVATKIGISVAAAACKVALEL